DPERRASDGDANSPVCEKHLKNGGKPAENTDECASASAGSRTRFSSLEDRHDVRFTTEASTPARSRTRNPALGERHDRPFHHQGRKERKGQELNLQGVAARPRSRRLPSPVGLPLRESAEREGVEPSRLVARPGSSRVPSPLGLPFRSVAPYPLG